MSTSVKHCNTEGPEELFNGTGKPLYVCGHVCESCVSSSKAIGDQKHSTKEKFNPQFFLQEIHIK